MLLMQQWVNYDAHARSRPRTDFWGQVRRTVHGRPVSDKQIDLIVAAVVAALGLGADDTLLDLACGNGALSDRLFQCCAGGVGVDVSEYLIGVAQEYFATPSRQYVRADAVDWVEAEADPGRFTKAVCYGSFSYLSDDAAARMLRTLHRRFPRVGHVLLGNLPDPARASRFYGASPDATGRAGKGVGRAPDLRTPDLRTPDLRTPESDLGIWRDEAEITALAGQGWQVTTRPMPPEFFAAHYRYDALLVRQ